MGCHQLNVFQQYNAEWIVQLPECWLQFYRENDFLLTEWYFSSHKSKISLGGGNESFPYSAESGRSKREDKF